MKNKMLSALLLGALMMNSLTSFAMVLEEERDPPTAPPRPLAPRWTAEPQDSALLNLPEGVRHFILTLLDSRSFFDFKQTSRMSYDIASDPRFYLETTPADLIDYLKKCIDQKGQKIHFSPLIPLISRTKNAGEFFFNAVQSYLGPLFSQASFERMPEQLQQQLEAWQPYGLALRLGVSVNHLGAQKRYDTLCALPFTREYAGEHFFHLLTERATFFPIQTQTKLEYRFLNLAKKLTQDHEENYMAYIREATRPQKFSLVFEYVQSALYAATVDPSLIDFWRKKELQLIDNHIDTLKKFLNGKEPGTQKEAVLKQNLREAAVKAQVPYTNTATLTESFPKKVAYFLKLASLLEEVGENQKATINYDSAGFYSQNLAKKVEYGLKSAALHEASDRKAQAASTYITAAFYLPDKAEKRGCFSKAIDLATKSGDKSVLARAYAGLGNFSETRAEQVMYSLKVAALFEEVGDKRQMAYAHQNLAVYCEDPVQKVAHGLKAASLFEELGQLAKAANHYEHVAMATEDRAERNTLFSKAGSLYEQTGDYKKLAKLYLTRAFHAESNAKKAEAVKTAFSLLKKKTTSKKGPFYTSFFLSLIADHENERATWQETAAACWQAIPKTPKTKKSLDKAVQELLNLQQEGLARILAQFIAESWPQEVVEERSKG